MSNSDNQRSRDRGETMMMDIMESTIIPIRTRADQRVVDTYGSEDRELKIRRMLEDLDNGGVADLDDFAEAYWQQRELNLKKDERGKALVIAFRRSQERGREQLTRSLRAATHALDTASSLLGALREANSGIEAALVDIPDDSSAASKLRDAIDDMREGIISADAALNTDDPDDV